MKNEMKDKVIFYDATVKTTFKNGNKYSNQYKGRSARYILQRVKEHIDLYEESFGNLKSINVSFDNPSAFQL